MLLLSVLHLLWFVKSVSSQCSSAIYSTQVCEDAMISLQCSIGNGIIVNSAFYGRLDRTTCVHAQMSNTNCNLTKATLVVSNSCNGLMSCNVKMSNSYFGADPCLGLNFFIVFCETNKKKHQKKAHIRCYKCEFAQSLCENTKQKKNENKSNQNAYKTKKKKYIGTFKYGIVEWCCR